MVPTYFYAGSIGFYVSGYFAWTVFASFSIYLFFIRTDISAKFISKFSTALVGGWATWLREHAAENFDSFAFLSFLRPNLPPAELDFQCRSIHSLVSLPFVCTSSMLWLVFQHDPRFYLLISIVLLIWCIFYRVLPFCSVVIACISVCAAFPTAQCMRTQRTTNEVVFRQFIETKRIYKMKIASKNNECTIKLYVR